MFFNITHRSASSANDQHVPQTLILPSLRETKSSNKNIKTRTASSLFSRKVTNWCKSPFKRALNTSQQTVNPTRTTLPTCPRHPAALWDGITYAYANADEAFAAEEARRKVTYDAPCQCSIGANVAPKMPLPEEVEPKMHQSTHLTPVHARKNVFRTAAPRASESNELFITLPVVARISSNASMRITFPVIPRITYKAPLLITCPQNASNLASLFAFISAKPVGFAQSLRVRLEPLDALLSTITSSLADSQVLPLVFDADLWAPVTFALAHFMAVEAVPVGLVTSSMPIPEWFIEMNRASTPTSSDAWRQFDILPPSRPRLFIEMPQTQWSSAALSRTTSSSLYSPTFSPTSTSNISRLSNDDLLTNSALSSPTTTAMDEEESHGKNYSPDLNDSIQHSPRKITKKTPGTVGSEGRCALNPGPLAVPRALLIALFPEDYVNTVFENISLFGCQEDEEGASDLDGWSDMGSIPDEVDQNEAIAPFPTDNDDTDLQTSLEGCYMDEDAEEDFESWSEMGSIPDESDMDEVTAAPSPIHCSKSAPVSLDSSVYSIPSDTSSQGEDWSNLPAITFSPATSFDDDPKEDGWPFELEMSDDDGSLVDGMQSVTDFVLAGLVEDEGDIFDDSDASLVRAEGTDDTDTDTSRLLDLGAPLDPTELDWATGWPKHVLEDLDIITRFVLAGLKPGESLDFDVSDALPELKYTIASPTNVGIQGAGPTLINTKVEPIVTSPPPSQSADISAGKVSLSTPTRLYANVSRGHSVSEKTDGRAKRSSFLSGKLALLTDMEHRLIEKGLGIYI
ncbi:hypothetical protein FRB96_002043 [Tulasnella sp. 330]|nr:hypothetical protein FRB96_002043 [Tulasnella sp. 330]KAG8877442.1 hypothetical protein FRB97_003403 [Tulasnella sp. 331]KAG8882901.1 hypothetical protein FRB98_003397 [Tulasnella sp. 332]